MIKNFGNYRGRRLGTSELGMRKEACTGNKWVRLLFELMMTIGEHRRLRLTEANEDDVSWNRGVYDEMISKLMEE
jgi:hypothetical protein